MKQGGRGFETVMVRLSAVWVALVLANYAGSALTRPGAAPRFEEIRREMMAGRSADPAVIVRTVGGIAVSTLALAGMLGTGLVLLRFVLRKTGAGAGRLPWAAAAGFGLGGLAALGIGFTGLFRPAIAWIALLAAAAAAIPLVGSRSLRTRGRRRNADLGGQWPLVVVGAGVLAACSAALGPETEIDSLSWHLSRARHLLLHGRLVMQPSVLLSFPPVWELWLGLHLATGGEQAARFLNPLVVAATAWLLKSMVDRARSGAGSLAAALYAGSYLTLVAGSASKNDPSTAWMCLAAFAAVARGIGRAGVGWAALAGGYAGAAVMVKLTAVPGMAVAGGVLARAGGRRLVLGTTVALGICLPWAAHNTIQWQNPVHPVLRDHSTPTPPPGASANHRQDLWRYVIGSYEGLGGKVRAIWSIAMAEGMTPLPLLAVPVVIAGPIAGRWWALAAVALAALWSIGPPQPRYLLPALPLCAAAIAGWVADGSGAHLRVRWRLVAVAVLVSLEVGRAWFEPSADRSARFAVATGSLSRESYLRLRLTTWAEVTSRINAALPSSSQILPVGERRGFPIERRFVAVSFDDPAPFLRLASNASSVGRVGVKFRQFGVTHVLYNPMTADFLSADFAMVRPADRALRVWAGWWRAHAEAVALPLRSDLREGEYALFTVRRTPVGRAPALLPGIEGWTDAVARQAASGDRAGALARLARVRTLAGEWPVLELWRVLIAGESMPAGEARSRLERAEASGLRVAHVYLGLARAAGREGRKDLVKKYAETLRNLAPDTWLRMSEAGSATLVGR